jgi:hypothetical protein
MTMLHPITQLDLDLSFPNFHFICIFSLSVLLSEDGSTFLLAVHMLEVKSAYMA